MKKKKNQKPTDYDIHFKYICFSCGLVHWASLLETQTKNFKIVCDCRNIIKPKRISKIKILYAEKIKEISNVKSSNTIKKQVMNILSMYGFNENESSEIVESIYNDNQNCGTNKLVKLCIEKFGEKYGNNKTNEF